MPKGFQNHPENINRKGRPPKAKSMTGLMEKFLNKSINVPIRDNDGKIICDGVTGEPETRKVKRKEMFIENVYTLAMQGDVPCIKYIWDRLEGKPAQKIEAFGPGGDLLDIKVNFVDKVEGED